jgi:hypothetical protein
MSARAAWLRPASVALWPLLLMATGAYSVLPGSGFAIFGVALLLLLFEPAFRRAPGRLWTGRQILGLAVFNGVFLLFGVWHGLAPRLYFLHMFTLSMFLLGFGCATLAWSEPLHTQLGRGGPRVLIGLLGLVGLLAGQLLQAMGALPAIPPPAQGFLPSLVFRPGGFQNTNMTASIGLLMLWIVGPHRGRRIDAAGWTGLGLSLVVLGLTQSRAGLLALTVYGLWIFRRHPGRIAAALLLLLCLSWTLGAWERDGVFADLVLRLGSRFEGDKSSDERAWLLRMAFQEIQNAPFFGQGYLILDQRHGGGGSHNQFIESMVSFGIFGAAAMVLSAVLLISPASGMLVLIGILPTFFFSHNFFDSAAFQTSLGMALAFDRLSRHRSDSAATLQ